MSYASPRHTRRVAPRPEAMSELREHLAMPGCRAPPNNNDICFDHRSLSKSVTSSKSKMSNKPTYVPPSRGSVDSPSTRSIDASGAGSTSSGSGWGKKKVSQQKRNQIVAEFFDVQSFASAPVMVGGRHKTKDLAWSNFETRSVVSKKSVAGSFMSLFFRNRNVVNDEACFGNGTNENMSQDDRFDTPSVDDEDLTLGSGLNSESGDTIFNEELDDSTVVVKEKIQLIMAKEDNPSPPKKRSFISRLFQRRHKDVERNDSKKAAKENDKLVASKTEVVKRLPVEKAFDESKSVNDCRQSKSQCSAISTSLATPVVVTDSATITATAPSDSAAAADQKSFIRASRRNSYNCSGWQEVPEKPRLQKSSSCRWSGDDTIEASSLAPKRPMRRMDSGKVDNIPVDDGDDGDDGDDCDDGERPIMNEEYEFPRLSAPNSPTLTLRPPRRQESNTVTPLPDTKAPRPPQRRERSIENIDSPTKDINVEPKDRNVMLEHGDKVWRDNVRREISCRIGKDLQESKEEFDRDDSDESVLSLLSGLLATWSAERDGAKLIVRNGDIAQSGFLFKPMKSILKSSDACVQNKPRCSVIFENIIIREYERTVGDNPSCTRGPPISIGWSYVLAHEYPIDDYELLIKTPKRSKKEFHLSADIRTQLLMEEWECTEEEIRKARREVTYIQYCRAKSSFTGVRSPDKEGVILRKGGNTTGKNSNKDSDGGKVVNRRWPARPDSGSVGFSSPPAPKPPVRNASDCRPSSSISSSVSTLVQRNNAILS